MKKIDLGQTMNTLANIGVIAGIAFLAIELNQNQDLARAQMRNDIALNWQENSRGDIEGRISELLVRDEHGEPLDEVDQLRLDIWRGMWLRSLENIHYQFRRGLYSEQAFRANMNILRNDTGLRAYLCEHPESFDPDFLAYVNSQFEDGCE